MRTVSFFFRIALLAIGFVAMASNAVAQIQAPGKPIEFQAKPVEVTANGGWAKLMWMANRDGGIPTHFDIYMAEGETEDQSKFEKVGSVDVDPNGQPGTMFMYYQKDLPLGTYTFYVVAVNNGGESDRSLLRVVTLKVNSGEDKKLVIVSRPGNTAKPGSTYEYQVRVEANFNYTALRYKITNGPDGMTISDKGLIRWENAKQGRHVVRVVVWATLPDGTEKETVQEFVIEVGEGNSNNEPCTKICGTVKNENGESVARGYVTAWSMTERRTENGEVKKDWVAVYKAVMEQGEFCIKVAAGTYKIKFEMEGFYSEWWENSETSDDATDVTVTCDAPADGVNFVVAARPQPIRYSVKGRVYDAETQEGLKNALVTFTAREKEGVDSRYRVVKTETDEDGNYIAALQADYAYVGTAISRENRERSKYLQEWWENTHDATQATSITLTDSIEGVDFSMDLRPQATGGFGGTMKNDSTGAGVPGKVTAFMIVSKQKENGSEEGKLRVETVETDADGNYEFTNLEAGEYIVFGMPGERPYVPGFYVNDAVAAHSWKDATRISVGDVMLTVQHDIRLETAKDGVGRGKLRGWVYDKRGGIIKQDGGVQATNGIMGSLVVAIDEAGDVVDFAMTTEEGAYEMTQLGLGASTIIADRIGFEPTTESVTFDPQTLTKEVSIGLIKVVSSVEVPTDLVGTTINLYPNPASENATISFPSVDGMATVRVISAAGLVLSNEAFTATNGTTSFSINTSSLPSGMVMVHVTNGTSTFALPLQIVR